LTSVCYQAREIMHPMIIDQVYVLKADTYIGYNCCFIIHLSAEGTINSHKLKGMSTIYRH
jgi:hypothetical protein